MEAHKQQRWLGFDANNWSARHAYVGSIMSERESQIFPHPRWKAWRVRHQIVGGISLPPDNQHSIQEEGRTVLLKVVLRLNSIDS